MSDTPRHQDLSTPDLNRRRWLLRSATLMGASLGAGTLVNLLAGQRPAYAADYKAMVCIFLYGGNDGMNMVVPTDAARYNQYAGVRGPLALPLAGLQPLAGTDFGLHPAMAALAPAWSQGQLAPVFNVGPLFAPLTKQQYRDAPEGSDLIPDSLFSHADQQALWDCGSTDAQNRTGWGGRGSAELQTINPVIAINSSGRFGLEPLRVPLVLPTAGSVFGAYGLQPDDLQWEPQALRKAAIDSLYADDSGMALRGAYNGIQASAFEVSARLGDLIKSVPGDAMSSPEIDAAFAPLIVNGRVAEPLAAQLYQIAKLIAANALVQGNRQMFFASEGGFDTHSGQISGDPSSGLHALLLGNLARALAAFQDAMNRLGLAQQVTSFTQSDFGRTFAPNASSGTDHAWGNHHLVMGGAVKGGATYGRYPELVLGGPDDVGVDAWELQGRWIPTSGVDQYAATLLQWFGASKTQLNHVLPNLKNFGAQRTLGFL